MNDRPVRDIKSMLVALNFGTPPQSIDAFSGIVFDVGSSGVSS